MSDGVRLAVWSGPRTISTALMRAWEATGTPYAAFLAPDGLHHNDRGYACLAAALARSIQDAVGPARIAGR